MASQPLPGTSGVSLSQKSPESRYFETVFFVENSRVLARLLAVVAAFAQKGKLFQLSHIIQLPAQGFLRAKHIEFMVLDQALTISLRLGQAFTPSFGVL